jgi:hypothetical protein
MVEEGVQIWRKPFCIFGKQPQTLPLCALILWINFSHVTPVLDNRFFYIKFPYIAKNNQKEATMAIYTVPSTTEYVRRVANTLGNLLGRVRLSFLYAVIGAIVALAWIISVLASGNSLQSNQPTKSNTTTNGSATSLQIQPNDSAGGQEPMDVSTPDASSNTNASVQSDDNGTTVTVNGSEQTVAPGQSFQQSYSSPDGNSQTDVSVSGSSYTNNSSQSTSRSVHVHTHSSTRSDSYEP